MGTTVGTAVAVCKTLQWWRDVAVDRTLGASCSAVQWLCAGHGGNRGILLALGQSQRCYWFA